MIKLDTLQESGTDFLSVDMDVYTAMGVLHDLSLSNSGNVKVEKDDLTEFVSLSTDHLNVFPRQESAEVRATPQVMWSVLANHMNVRLYYTLADLIVALSKHDRTMGGGTATAAEVSLQPLGFDLIELNCHRGRLFQTLIRGPEYHNIQQTLVLVRDDGRAYLQLPNSLVNSFGKSD